MEFLTEYGLFLAKTLTWVIAIAVIIGLVASAGSRVGREEKGKLEVKKLNDVLDDTREQLLAATLSAQDHKKHLKEEKKARKTKKERSRKKAPCFCAQFSWGYSRFCRRAF